MPALGSSPDSAVSFPFLSAGRPVPTRRWARRVYFFRLRILSAASLFSSLRFPLGFHAPSLSCLTYTTVFNVSDDTLNLDLPPGTVLSRHRRGATALAIFVGAVAAQWHIMHFNNRCAKSSLYCPKPSLKFCLAIQLRFWYCTSRIPSSRSNDARTASSARNCIYP